MQLYRGTVPEMREDLLADKLVQRLGQRFLDQFFYPPSDSEARSWEHSLTALAPVLESAGLGEAEVLIEYQLPLTRAPRRRPQGPPQGGSRR